MFADAGTKEMPQDHRRQTLTSAEWSYCYDEKYVKQTIKPKKPARDGPEVLTGAEVSSSDPMIGFLQGLCTQPGWHKRNNMAIQVAFRAKSFRRPEPRFEAAKYRCEPLLLCTTTKAVGVRGDFLKERLLTGAS